MTTTRQRVNNKIIETITIEHDAIIDYADILAGCTIEDEDDCEKPWDNSDCHEHTTIPADENMEDARAFVHRSRRDGGSILILLDVVRSHIATPEYFSALGASKQVSAELHAREIRQTIDQLVEWYTNGWQWYAAVCKFTDHIASCGMIDDARHAERDIFPELCAEICNELIAEGYTIINRPAPAPRNEWKKERIKDNVHRFDVSGR